MRRWVTRGVVGIVLATFFSDVGHEMVTAVLPLYLTSVGLGPAALGVMEGAADFAFSLSKLAGGIVGHRLERKRPLTAAGYGVTALGTASIALVSSAPVIGLLRIIAWIGRGFRGPLRDFLLADEVEESHFGRAYGMERSADMLGAVVGPLIALVTLGLGFSLVTVIGMSFLPSLLSAVSILAFTRDRVVPASDTSAEQGRPKPSLPRQFWLFVVGVLLFGLGDFSRTFLIYLVADSYGGSVARGALTAGVLTYTLHNAISGLAAFPAGRIGDRVPKWKVLATGYALGIVTNLFLATGHSNVGALSAAVLCSGVYIAVEETVEKAAVAELLPREQRSLGFGVLASANAVGDMVSSLYVGTLLARGQGSLAFGLAATLATLGTAWIFAIGRLGGPAASAT